MSVVVVGRSIGNGLEEIILWRNNDWERCHLLEMGDMTHRHWEGGEGEGDNMGNIGNKLVHF